MPDGAELFLLRNLSRGAGVGFFETDGFYPDFIMWIKTGESQRIVLVEPTECGTLRRTTGTKRYSCTNAWNDDQRPGGTVPGYKNVQLDSFIVSTTSYQDLKPYYGNGDWSEEDFKDKHILFQKRGTEYDYISFILQQ